MEQPIKVFYSYSHKDEELRKKLEDHLSSLRRNGEIEDWHDRKIVPGEHWDEEIAARLDSAQIILLLVSADFLASDYCYEKEMIRAVERHQTGEAVLIPIILRPCDWKYTHFGKQNIQSLPKDAVPVTKWTDPDDAFLNIVQGIRASIDKLRSSLRPFASSLKPDISGYEEQVLRQEVREINVANPYLLGDTFVGRKKELDDLTNWLNDDENRIFCIYNLGGTGKSALVWHWLNDERTRKLLEDREVKQFWCSFYAKSFDSTQFLRDLATQLGGVTVVEDDEFRSQMELKRFVMDRLENSKWLLVLDGLEREMGAFSNPEHYQIDSEEQDRKNEEKEIFYEEKYIRSHVFSLFIWELLRTRTKVLITSRIFPENLKSGDAFFPGVISYPLRPMTQEDAIEVWNISGEPDGSDFQEQFFSSVDFHPQVISVVSAAVREGSWRFSEWFNEFSDEERAWCFDPKSLTARRHRWLDLATRDLIRHRRDAWLTICYIVRRSEASSVETLMNQLVETTTTDPPKPGRFRSDKALIDVLKYLEKRRLIGVDFTRGMVDVHPVIRGQVVKYIMKQYEPGVQPDEEMIEHLASTGDQKELMLRFLNQPDFEERYRSLPAVLDEFRDNPTAQNAFLNIIGMFYEKERPGSRPWLDSLPALKLRKDQAYVLLRTGNELMTRGIWDESEKVFNRARIAYYLCGDLQSVEDCRHSHNWQALYGGDLMESERYQLDLLEKNISDEYPQYWLALLLSIRQSKHAADLLESLPSDTSRWTLQTVAEAWFYLEDYEKAASMARLALDRRKEERASVGQLLWETVTLGLASVRLGNADDAASNLDFAKDRGTGWSYNLVPMFALAGLIELHYLNGMNANSASDRMEQFSQAGVVYKLYQKYDSNDRFQIPAAEAHLAMARVHHSRKELKEAIELAQLALKTARGANPPFQYASLVNRATKFLIEELKQSVPDPIEPSIEAFEHEKRLGKWINSRKGESK